MPYQKNWPTWLGYAAAVVAFLLVAGYAVLYATGYRLDTKDWKLQKTGVLAITTKPSGATVYINDRKYSKATPLTLRNMPPGAYIIKLEDAGYRPFSKPIEIASGQVANEQNIDLVLEKPVTKTVATDASRILEVGNEIIYLNNKRQLVQISNGNTEAQVLDLSRLPANVKSVLTNTTDIWLAKKSGGTTWAVGVISSGHRWLVVADFQGGYRGQLFGTPLNQVTAEHLTWIDNDRLMVQLGTTLYTVDLNLNHVNQYTKSVLGLGYQNGKVYYITRGQQSSFIMLRDSNLFDERPAETWLTDLPVAKSYMVTGVDDDRVILVADNGGVSGLWEKELKTKDAKWNKVASKVGQVWYEYNLIKPRIYYTVGHDFFSSDPVTGTETKLHSFTQTVQLLGKQDESLFLQADGKLWVSDTAGANVYELADISSQGVWLGSDSKRIWLLGGQTLTEWTLRQNDPGIFGGLGSFWIAPM